MRSLSLLVKKEVRSLLTAPAFWLLLLCVSLLTGYSFIEAARLFSEASRSAGPSPELSRALSPLDGIFVPTFGGLYLASTLLYPFLAIRFISLEKENDSLKLLLQMPVSFERIVVAKVLALGAGWITALAVPISAALLWAAKGGHIGYAELANLLLGQGLYAAAITGIALVAGAVADSTAAAALLTLAVILGNWVLDFSAQTQGGWVREAATFSLTGCLHSFEKGLFSSPQASVLVLTALVGPSIAAIWLRTGELRFYRVVKASSIVIVGILIVILCARLPFYHDASEDKRNSFNPEDEQALSHLSKPLNIKVYLSPEDSRLWDLDRTVLSKLKRVVPKARASLEASGSALGASGNDRYGLIVFEYDGKTGETRSTSEEEALPIIYSLAGEKPPKGREWNYPGYPLTVDFSSTGAWFYIMLPVLLGFGWWWFNVPNSKGDS